MNLREALEVDNFGRRRGRPRSVRSALGRNASFAAPWARVAVAHWVSMAIALFVAVPVFAQGAPESSSQAESTVPATAAGESPAPTSDANDAADASNPSATTPGASNQESPNQGSPSQDSSNQGGAAPPAAPSPAQSASPPAGASTSVDATTYVVRLRDLESRVDELKEQIRRSHTRLSLLSDTILAGGVGGADAEIVFRNEMTNAFRVVSVLFVLDGAVLKKEQDDTGELAAKKSIPVLNGPISPGDHTLQVVVVFQGHGYGVFSYLRAHKYTTKHTHSFTVAEGTAVRIQTTAYEKGGVTTPIDQRPNVRFTETIIGGVDGLTSGAE